MHSRSLLAKAVATAGLLLLLSAAQAQPTSEPRSHDPLNAKAAFFAIEKVFDEVGFRVPLMASVTFIQAGSVRNMTGQTVEALLDARAKTIPAKRFGTPKEFGAICAFLCSQHAGYLTGQNILADGGAYPGTF